MATANYSAPCTHADDATFRAWGKALSDALQTLASLTKTTDTGQVNWATVARPGTNSMGGYEIYRFNDSLQATNAVFIRLEWGTGTAATTPAMRVSIAGATDGAGNLIGSNKGASNLLPGGASATVSSCYVSSAAGRLDIALHVTSISGMAISICRTRDDSGNMTSTGVDVIVASTKGQQFIPREGTGGAFPSAPLTNYTCAAPSAGTGSFGGNIGVYPIHPVQGYSGNPTGAMVYFTADLASNSSMSITVYGASVNFISQGALNISTVNGNAGGIGLLIRND